MSESCLQIVLLHLVIKANLLFLIHKDVAKPMTASAFKWNTAFKW